MFLASTAALGGDRRSVMLSVRAGKKIPFIKKARRFLFPRHHPVLLGSGARKQRFPCMVKALIQSPAGLDEPSLRTPCVLVSQSHKQLPPVGHSSSSLASRPCICGSKAQLLQLSGRHAISQAENTPVDRKHNILFA